MNLQAVFDAVRDIAITVVVGTVAITCLGKCKPANTAAAATHQAMLLDCVEKETSMEDVERCWANVNKSFGLCGEPQVAKHCPGSVKP